jgi:hypothetical protein
MNVLVWHAHGSYTTSLVQGTHTYLVPVVPSRGPEGRGRATSWRWPGNVVEVAWDQLRGTPVDVVIAQRPHDLELFQAWTGLVPGRDVPVVFLEHNTPGGDVPFTAHPMRDREDLTLVHVTAFNALFWDNGRTPVRVIEHGVPDPETRWTGDVPRAGVVVNEPVRRGRAVGTDLLPQVSQRVGVDVFGMGVRGLRPHLGLDDLGTFEDLPQSQLLSLLAQRRVYVHLTRWTSLGLSLVEAMALGMPIVALATTAAVDAVPAAAGCVTTDVRQLLEAVSVLARDEARAAAAGAASREQYERRFGLGRFLDDWDAVLKEVTS